MKAIHKFRLTTKRCEALLNLWIELNENPTNLKRVNNDYDDLIRASMVLVIAAMDHYYTNKFMEMLTPFLQKKAATKKLADLIQESGITFQEAMELLKNPDPYKKIRKKVYSKTKRYVAQNLNKIDDLFIAYGITKFTENVEKMSGKKDLIRNINLIVKRRHSIVHTGDLNPNGSTKNLGKSHNIKKIRDVLLFVETSELLLNNIISPLKI